MGSQFRLEARSECQARLKSATAVGMMGSSVFLIDIVSVSPFKGIGRRWSVYIVNALGAGSGRLKHDQHDQKVRWEVISVCSREAKGINSLGAKTEGETGS